MRVTRPKLYMMLTHGAASAVGPFRATSEQRAREQMRQFLGVKRLPNGTGVWVTDEWWRNPTIFASCR